MTWHRCSGRIFRVSLTVLLAALANGCSDASNGPSAPGTQVPEQPEAPAPPTGGGPVVSEPTVESSFNAFVVDGAGGRRSSVLAGALQEDVSYVSLAPGTEPEADSVDIRNRTRDLSTGGIVVDGGFDPIPIPASVGDILVITILSATVVLEREERSVPDRRPPVVVRSSPPSGWTRVPLNSVIVIVFSEPVDPSTASVPGIAMAGAALDARASR